MYGLIIETSAGASWGLLVLSWGLLVPPGASCDLLERLWRLLGLSVASWALLGLPEGFLVPLWASWGTSACKIDDSFEG